MDAIQGRVIKFDDTGAFTISLKSTVTLELPGYVVLGGRVDDPMNIVGYVDGLSANRAGGVDVSGELMYGDEWAAIRDAVRKVGGLMKGRRLVEWSVKNRVLVPVHADLDAMPVDAAAGRR
ncbi:hypothetical protein CH253_19810 [Rhodococcus sp. 06-156-3C]|uniref:hypothetical protein n=1 Tax=Nocardiaceae TaxID=85025 RepID=UPI00068D795F|nr:MULTISPECIES: hypothetical protein [Rhodococcus]OZD17097.1 hypothetical protein CH253_19810 [Rhodococcus sp. 06-156-3C]OZD18435.1 hypothetical protein CH248_16630 [Rhodococcus sp. 06-156-4a]OZD28364.1 hypothetical protein CH284_29035 [Rhodococcus sp. 06-156-3]OZD29867.1 hypothetical protein CH247_15815 [Rhodococcus sp. 06-156-3b]OZF57801.1 hypothetical protein CH290_25140 [Rhodococcus sp. 06-156-4]